MVPEDGVQVQVSVGEAEPDGRRPVTVSSRAGHAGQEWVRHAAGNVRPGQEPLGFDLAAWPPAGAEPVPVEGFYARPPPPGTGKGRQFQGLRAAWRRGGDLFAEVVLPDGEREQAGEYGGCTRRCWTRRCT